jgi:hypothetical protein
MKHQGGQGTFGGLLEPAATSEEAEKREPLNLRNPDLLDSVLQSVLKRKPGGMVTNKTFIIPQEYARATDITYDRFYFELNLLVHFFAATGKDYTDRESVEKEVEDMRTFALDKGFRFLPIIAGSVLPDDLYRSLAGQGIT